MLNANALSLLSWATTNIITALEGFDLLMEKIETMNLSGCSYGRLNAYEAFYDAKEKQVVLIDWNNSQLDDQNKFITPVLGPRTY